MSQGQAEQARCAAGDLWPFPEDPAAALTSLAKTAVGLGEGELAAGLMMQAVKATPRDPDLHFEFGQLLSALGWHGEAEREFLEAAGLAGDDGCPDLADRLRNAGRMREADMLYRRALDHPATRARACWGLGLLARASGLTVRCLEWMRQAVDLEPDHRVYRHETGLVLLESGHTEDALTHLRRAAELWPENGRVLGDLAKALVVSGDINGALDALETARKTDPARSDIHNNIGNIYSRVGRWAEAEAAYQDAIGIDPGLTQAHYNLGRLYQNQGRLDQAAACYRRVISILPGHAESHNNLGTIFYARGEWDRAVAYYRKAQELAPDWAVSFNNMANLLIKRSDDPGAAIPYARQALKLQPDYTEAAVILLDACQRVCAWDDWPDLESRVKQLSHQSLGFKGWTPENPICAIRSSFDQAHHLAVAVGWTDRLAESAAREQAVFTFGNHGASGEPIRLGYLSQDFRDHPVGHQIAGLFEHHDRRRFTTILYSGGPDDGSVYRARAEKGADRWVNVQGWSPRRIAEAVHGDGIDILIDLTGHSGGSLLSVCAMKPAPVQVSYLGYLGPSGAAFMDYLITDPVATPPSAAAYYTEKFVYLPHCYQVNDQRLPVSDVRFKRPDFGLPETGVVFACFNHLGKLDPMLFDTWMSLLGCVPDSVIWLNQGNETAVGNLRRRAKHRGIDPDRLVFSGRLPLPDHLARLKLADLALDTRMYNGGATTSNALWAGVPVITILGGHFVSRMAASALKAVGLPELVTRNLDEYRELAIRLALTPTELQGLGHRLRRNRDTWPLFDTPRFVRHLEKAFLEMGRRYQKGLPPAPIEIEDTQPADKRAFIPEA